MLNPLILTFPLILCAGCEVADTRSAGLGAGQALASDSCHTVSAAIRLSAEVSETSGLALSSSAAAFWTHNDRGGEPYIHAVGVDGRPLGRTAITGAALEDWEDIESGPCDSGMCLYIADIGDNSGSRGSVTIYEVAEPKPGAAASQAARALHARYPDGPHNAESLFILPGGDLYIVTKGDDGPITLYRYAASARAGNGAILEKVREIMPAPDGRPGRVTGASATPDGTHVAVRTYSTLYIYEANALVSGSGPAPVVVDLRGLGEPQGEGVAMDDDGTVWLSTEAEESGATPRLARLSCRL